MNTIIPDPDITHKYCGGFIDMNNHYSWSGYYTKKVLPYYETNRIAAAIWCASDLCTIINKYLTESAPWTLYNKDPHNPTIVKIVGTALSALLTIIIMFKPITQDTADRILSYITEESRENELVMSVKTGFTPFFPPINIKEIRGDTL